MSTPSVSTGARRFVIASVLFLLAGLAGTVAGAGRRTVVTLLLYGFVFHMIFGKAYALVPSYFDRNVSLTSAPTVQLPLSVLGTLVLATGGFGRYVGDGAGAVLWTAGVTVFVGTLGWTIRDNLTGSETGTGGANADRRGVDRYANLFVPLALGYLLVASVTLLLSALPVRSPFSVGAAQISHLLGAGSATLLFLAIGFRLFPRFLVAHPPKRLIWVVIPAGAIGPALIAVGLYSNLLVVGLLFEGVAVLGFAAVFLVLFVRTSRERVGFYGVLCGALSGLLGVALAGLLAVNTLDPAVITAHYRTMLVGFLGLSIVGAAYQFYPPTVGDLPGTSERTALVSVGSLAGGLLLQVTGLLAGRSQITTAGELGALAGAVLYAYLLGAAFWARR
jgi:hypothetical protein